MECSRSTNCWACSVRITALSGTSSPEPASPGFLEICPGPGRQPRPSQTADLVGLDLDPFTAYIEVITAHRVAFHRKYLTNAWIP